MSTVLVNPLVDTFPRIKYDFALRWHGFKKKTYPPVNKDNCFSIDNNFENLSVERINI